jgi:hypothetical protein
VAGEGLGGVGEESLIRVAIYGGRRAVGATRQRAACKSRTEMAALGLDTRLFLPCTRSSSSSMPLLVPAIVEVCLCTGPEPPVFFPYFSLFLGVLERLGFALTLHLLVD